MSLEQIKQLVQASIDVKQRVLKNETLLQTVEKVANALVESLKQDGKILFAGNGGSAADAQHLSAELSGRFYHDRDPLFAEALHVNTSYLTAVANDYSYDEVYSRLVKAKGRKGDVLVCLSTSGNSPNILRALETARKLGMITVGFTGETGGKMKALCDLLVNVPSIDTPRIQESHILLGHVMCQLVEEKLFKQNA
jgi:D-sedoheptulose 7-phosphate isomerase